MMTQEDIVRRQISRNNQTINSCILWICGFIVYGLICILLFEKGWITAIVALIPIFGHLLFILHHKSKKKELLARLI